MSGKSPQPAAAAAVPAAAKKMVQTLREIVNCPDAEIYAALRDSAMDPDEALNRLLAQDTFHEVKSKREKKKEIKEAPEPRNRAINNSSSRGARGGSDRGRRNSSNQSNAAGHGVAPINSNNNQKPVVPSYSSSKNVIAAEHSVPIQPSSLNQSTWPVMHGHMSMADIVKMGRSQGKPCSMHGAVVDPPYTDQSSGLSNAVSHSAMQSMSTILSSEPDPQDPALQISGVANEHENDHLYHENWSSHDLPAAGIQASVLDTPSVPALQTGSLEHSELYTDAVDNHERSHFDENNSIVQDLNYRSHLQAENPTDYSDYGGNLLKETDDFEAQRHSFEEAEVEDNNAGISSTTANFQHLSLQSEEPSAARVSEDNPAVIIPDHLQVANVECAHLSFGSFGSGAFSSLLPTHASKNNNEVSTVVEDSSPEQTDERNYNFYDDGPPKSAVDEVDIHISTGVSASLDTSEVTLTSQPDVARPDLLDEAGYQYLPNPSNHPYLEKPQPTNLEHQQGNIQLQNMATLSSISSLLHASSLQSSSPASNSQPPRNFDFSFSPLLAQSMATKYNNSMPSTSASPSSMHEAAKLDGGLPQLAQNLPSASIPAGQPLPQQLAMHHYSQPTLPLSPFANLIGYPYLPPSYTYLPPSTFQQPYSSNGPFHLPASAMPGANMKYSLPQYKNGMSPASLPLPSSVASAYGSYGNSSKLPGNYSLSNSTASPAMNLGLDDALSAHYKDASHYMALQQGDSSAAWLQAAGSRTLPAVPVQASTLYGYQGQSQQGNFRQGQQASQYGSNLGYTNLYHSQAGSVQEHSQNQSEGSLIGSQNAPSQPSHQLWQHTY